MRTIISSNPDFISRLLRYTKHLYIGNFVYFEEVTNILLESPALISFSCYIGSRQTRLIEQLRIQYASFAISPGPGLDLPLAPNSPLSSTLTHLEIWSNPRNMPKMEGLTRLTHLSVPYDWLYRGWVRTTLDSCKQLRVLVLQCLENDAEPLVVWGIDDCRVVTIDYFRDPKHWEESWGSQNGIWAHAEVIVSRREKGLGRHWTNAERVHLKRWRKRIGEPESTGLCPYGCDNFHRQPKR
jgi:hypothetical protein